jgi:hypothetical protein
MKQNSPINEATSETVNRYFNDTYGEKWGKNGEIDWDSMRQDDFDTYVNALHYAWKNVDGMTDKIPSIVIDIVTDLLSEYDEEEKGFSNPLEILSDIATYGDYGSFDDYKDEDTSDEDYIKLLEEDPDVVYYSADDRFVIWQLF